MKKSTIVSVLSASAILLLSGCGTPDAEDLRTQLTEAGGECAGSKPIDGEGWAGVSFTCSGPSGSRDLSVHVIDEDGMNAYISDELDSKPAQPTAVGKNWPATMEGSEQGSGGMELATWANDTLGGDQILESYAG